MISCNYCNYVLFAKSLWPGDSEGTFRSSSQAATCPPVYHTRWRLHTVLFVAQRQAGKLWIPIFIVFGLIRPGIVPDSTVSLADAISTWPPIHAYRCRIWRSWPSHRNRTSLSCWFFHQKCRGSLPLLPTSAGRGTAGRKEEQSWK